MTLKLYRTHLLQTEGLALLSKPHQIFFTLRLSSPNLSENVAHLVPSMYSLNVELKPSSVTSSLALKTKYLQRELVTPVTNSDTR